MKKIRIFLEDLIIVLEAMAANGTEEVMIFKHEETQQAAICDANNPDEIISFTAIDENDMTMDDNLH